MKGVVAIALGIVSVAALSYVVPDSEGQRLVSVLPQKVTAPSDNPSTPGRVALGKLLFWDPVLSGKQDVACATCHHPQFGYAENRDISIGVNGTGLGAKRRFNTPNSIPFVKRNSQTLLNVGFNGIDQTGRYIPATAPMFWDLRAKGLEAQALEPIKAFEEMRGDAYPEDKALDVVVGRLNAIPEYRTLFTQEFGGRNAVNATNIGKALAAFQRSLAANNSPFDRYMRGETRAMTTAQVNGMRRFERIGCANCHSGPMFSDFQPHVLGVPDNPALPESDRGIVDQPYAFRTASLRNLRHTAPYMHNGVFQSLDEVIEFYDDAPENPNVGRRQVDRLVRRLDDPDDEAEALIEFLDALNDDSFDRTIPSRVPSGLNPGGHIR
jgi:cytochrome c peroxidase